MRNSFYLCLALGLGAACTSDGNKASDATQAGGGATSGGSASSGGGGKSQVPGGGSNGKAGANSSAGDTSSGGVATTAGTGGSSSGGSSPGSAGTGGGIFGMGGVGGVTGTQILVDGSKVLQTMDGFGAAINPHSWDDGAVKPALDYLDTMGVRLWRVSYEMMDWETTNDDNDPNNFNWTAYDTIFSSPQFEELWSTIAYLNSKGYGPTIMLDFMGRVPDWLGGASLKNGMEAELAETIVAAAYYGRVTRKLDFGMLEPLNETDWDGIEGPQVDATEFATVMNDIATRIDGIDGLKSLRLVGPDTAMATAATGSYIPGMMGKPAVMAHVDAFTIHQYSASSSGLMASIAKSKFPTKHGWISETSSVFDAWAQVSEGVNAVILWDGYDSVYEHAKLAGRGSTAPNDAGNQPAALEYSNGKYTRRDQYYYWQQLCAFVEPGAQRVDAKSNVNGVDILAFNHPVTGQLTVLGANNTDNEQKLSIGLQFLASLPAAFSVYVTSSGQNFKKLADAPVASGKTSVTAPAHSIFTLTATP